MQFGRPKTKKGRPEGRPDASTVTVSYLEPAVGAALSDHILPGGVAAEEVLQPFHGLPALGFFENVLDRQHWVTVEPCLGKHGDGDLLFAAGELMPFAMNDQHAAVAGDPDRALVRRALQQACGQDFRSDGETILMIHHIRQRDEFMALEEGGG